MKVVSDTSPLNYLVLIDEIDLLPLLFSKVLVPLAVRYELTHRDTPDKVQNWIWRSPDWLEILPIKSNPMTEFAELDFGESQVLQLAVEFGISTVLMDESDGRRVAEKSGLKIKGILGILDDAAALGLVDFRRAFEKLEKTNFRVSTPVRTYFLNRNPEK